MNEAANENWSARTLDRNIGTQYYYRLLQSPKKEAVIAEMKKKTAEPKHQFELLKSPIVAEFLGFRTEDSFAESDLESAILSHIRDFLMEMGKGFAFVARQQHIVTDTEDYYIDLVFYNIELKCYVLIDLKMGTITHFFSKEFENHAKISGNLFSYTTSIPPAWVCRQAASKGNSRCKGTRAQRSCPDL